ncbi:protein of unknown function [Pseudomonas sp. JV551A1]|uniref:Uncharacterized protein n=1 Tax=Pseudomonas inefficax TaxID=2078786 RepID=A0AAQ1PEN8_9PSED|nr:protein of unknown function [Pseudomonas sp. JV551A1]SPO63938.1 protein of unknown function [Pseudomonas inefficax]
MRHRPLGRVAAKGRDYNAKRSTRMPLRGLRPRSRHKAAPTGIVQPLWERPCVAKGPHRGPRDFSHTA